MRRRSKHILSMINIEEPKLRSAYQNARANKTDKCFLHNQEFLTKTLGIGAFQS